jgi:hypothetical protein
VVSIVWAPVVVTVIFQIATGVGERKSKRRYLGSG